MKWKQGDEVKFRDGNATGFSVVVGVVNGEPMTTPMNGGTTFVPVWCERDSGREPTTVMVNAENIVEDDR